MKKKLRPLTREESLQMNKAYCRALDDMAYLLHSKTGEKTHALIDYNKKHTNNISSTILISLALSKPPVRLVQGATSGTGELKLSQLKKEEDEWTH